VATSIPPGPLAIEVRRVPGELDVVCLGGELDLAGEDAVRRALTATAAPRVVVDLSSLDFIDARGVAALVDAARELESAGRHLELRGARRLVRRVLVVLQLDSLLTRS
jgi:anti-sigma B factor antagonist